MTGNPLTYIPQEYRKIFYGIYATAGLVLGSIAIASDAGWVGTTLEVFAFVGVATGATAVANVPAPELNDPEDELPLQE